MAAALLALGTADRNNDGWKSEALHHPTNIAIAVLPFESLGEQKENTSFADGVQDDILTKLAKIGDLKVISRNSVVDYRGKRNVRQIGEALRVSHVLKGTDAGAVIGLI